MSRAAIIFVDVGSDKSQNQCAEVKYIGTLSCEKARFQQSECNSKQKLPISIVISKGTFWSIIFFQKKPYAPVAKNFRTLLKTAANSQKSSTAEMYVVLA